MILDEEAAGTAFAISPDRRIERPLIVYVSSLYRGVASAVYASGDIIDVRRDLLPRTLRDAESLAEVENLFPLEGVPSACCLSAALEGSIRNGIWLLFSIVLLTTGRWQFTTFS